MAANKELFPYKSSIVSTAAEVIGAGTTLGGGIALAASIFGEESFATGFHGLQAFGAGVLTIVAGIEWDRHLNRIQDLPTASKAPRQQG